MCLSLHQDDPNRKSKHFFSIYWSHCNQQFISNIISISSSEFGLKKELFICVGWKKRKKDMAKARKKNLLIFFILLEFEFLFFSCIEREIFCWSSKKLNNTFIAFCCYFGHNSRKEKKPCYKKGARVKSFING